MVALEGRIMKRRRQRSPAITAELAAEIKYLWQHTDWNQAQIAVRLGALNQGRISEIVCGRRYAEVPPARGSTYVQ